MDIACNCSGSLYLEVIKEWAGLAGLNHGRFDEIIKFDDFINLSYKTIDQMQNRLKNRSKTDLKKNERNSMRATKNRIKQTGCRPSGIFAMALTLAGAVFFLWAVLAPVATAGTSISKIVEHKGHSVQLFNTPEEQLRYCQSWFPNLEAKRAAFEVLLEHFDHPVSIRAEAHLELAYLALGDDYRVATEKDCDLSIALLSNILKLYANQPAVCAKAAWYLGWIYADLLGRKQEGLIYYNFIANNYGETLLHIEPPVPWVSLVLPQIETKTPAVNENPNYSWGSIALLEIIRHCKDDGKRWRAFKRLWDGYRNSPAIGYAVRKLLNTEKLALKAAPFAHILIKENKISHCLKSDIASVLNKPGANKALGPAACGTKP